MAKKKGYKESYRDRLPASNIAGTNQAPIVQAVCDGSYIAPQVFPVTLTDGTHELQLTAMADAFKIGTMADSVRPNVSHRTAQAIADLVGMVVPTAKMADALADQAPLQLSALYGEKVIPARREDGVGGGNFVRSEPKPGSIRMDRNAMEEESRRIDQMLQKLGLQPDLMPPGLALNQIGKIWVSSPILLHPGNLTYGKKTAINYGFWDKSGGGTRPAVASTKWRVWQRPGAAHDVGHADYSQRLVLFNRLGSIRGGAFGPNWRTIDIDEVALNPDTAGLVHHEKVTMAVRHPWLPFFKGGDCQTLVASGPPPGGGKPASSPSGGGGGVIPVGNGGSSAGGSAAGGAARVGSIAPSDTTEVQYWLVGLDPLSASSKASGFFLRHDPRRRPPSNENDKAAAAELRRLASESGGRGQFEIRKMVWPTRRRGEMPDLRIGQAVLDRFVLGGIVPGRA